MAYLHLEELGCFVFDEARVFLSEEEFSLIDKSFEFLKEFSKDKVIYGINTGFGPMAQYRISDENQAQLQYNLIRSHANGTGNFLSSEQTRAVMLCRLNTLKLGYSGTSLEIIKVLGDFINHKIYPLIPQHGGVGASGDLVQLAHLALGLIGEGEVLYQNKVMPAAEAIKLANLTKAELKLRDGLSLINGTSCMSGIAALNLIQMSKLIYWSILCSSVMNELTASYNDSFSKELNESKLHKGQHFVAQKMRDILENGNVLKNRDDHLFNKDQIEGREYFSEKVQEYYSLRCVPQIIGPIYDAFCTAKKVVEDEINSANDNPIVCAKSRSVYHGGNFHGDYVAFEMDKIKIGVTKLSMLMERQINYLLNQKLNHKFPPFLNVGQLGFNFGLQGMQFTAVSTTAENQSLSTPVYIHSIPSNGDNQDIVSMGTNAALMAQKVIDNTFEVLSVHLVAIAQAIDIDNNFSKLSEDSKMLYNFVRESVPKIIQDKPNYKELAALKAALLSSKKNL